MRRARRVAAAALVTVAAASALACQIVLQIDGKDLVDAGDDGSRASDAGVADGAASQDGPSGAGDAGDGAPVRTSCPTSVQGATLVGIPSPFGGVMCIDATEVTHVQYEAFLAALRGGAQPKQPPECSWNATFAPNPACDDAGTGCSGTDCNSFPRNCVDWCDAWAYCAWAGKALCGAFDGGPSPYGVKDDPRSSQWTNACTSGGKHAFPYGDAYVAGLCRTFTSSPVGGGTLPDCQSKETGYKNVYDLSGNVSEWENSCISSTGQSDSCTIRGGDYGFEDDDVRCATARFDSHSRDTARQEVGFRCCAP